MKIFFLVVLLCGTQVAFGRYSGQVDPTRIITALSNINAFGEYLRQLADQASSGTLRDPGLIPQVYEQIYDAIYAVLNQFRTQYPAYAQFVQYFIDIIYLNRRLINLMDDFGIPKTVYITHIASVGFNEILFVVSEYTDKAFPAAQVIRILNPKVPIFPQSQLKIDTNRNCRGVYNDWWLSIGAMLYNKEYVMNNLRSYPVNFFKRILTFWTNSVSVIQTLLQRSFTNAQIESFKIGNFFLPRELHEINSALLRSSGKTLDQITYDALITAVEKIAFDTEKFFRQVEPVIPDPNL